MKLFCLKMSLVVGAACTLAAHASVTFRLTQQTETIPEAGQVTRYSLSWAGLGCSFIQPGGWGGLVRESERMVLFRPQTSSMRLSLKFRNARETPPLPSLAEDWPPYLQALLGPDVRILETDECYAANLKGPMFTLQTAPDQPLRRLAFIQREHLLLEFELVAAREHFAEAHIAWTALLNSIRVTREIRPPSVSSPRP